MAPFLDRLCQGPLIADGAMGTQLAARGLPPGACGLLWNVERPEDVLAIHRDYVQAGATVLLTNTFGGSRWALERHGLAGRLEELNRAGAALARQAIRDAPDHAAGLVLGDIGPTGELPEPYGTRPIEEFEAVFAEQAAALADTDAIIVETMIAVEECAAAVRAARAATKLPVIASLAFDYNPRRDAFFTAMGVSPQAMVAALTEAGADLLGVNCGTIDITQMARLVAILAGIASMPNVAKPNAGRPELRAGRTRYGQAPEDFAAGGPALVAAGARIVGGCCGTTPAHIAALARGVRGRA